MRQSKNERAKACIIKNCLFGLFGAAVMICLAVSITVWFRPLYYFDIGYLQIPQMSGVSAELCRLNYDTLIDYNVLGGSEILAFPTMKMSESGTIHFEEVKQIFVVMQILALAGLAAFAVFLFQNRKCLKRKAPPRKDVLEIFRWMHCAVILTLGLGAIVLFATFIDWEGAFAMMHSIFFDNDYWLFDPQTDPIITILPDTFFLHCGLLILCLIALFCAGLEILYRKARNNDGKSHI